MLFSGYLDHCNTDLEKLIKIEDGYSDTIEPRLEGIRDYLETLKGHIDEVKFPQLSIADLTEHNPRITERNPLVPKESTLVRDTVLVDRDDIPFFVWFGDGLNGVTRGASSNRGYCIVLMQGPKRREKRTILPKQEFRSQRGTRGHAGRQGKKSQSMRCFSERHGPRGNKSWCFIQPFRPRGFQGR